MELIEAKPMRRKAFEDIRGISDELKQAMIEAYGRPPDVVVESPAAGIVGLPDLDADPEARSAIEALERVTESENVSIHALIGGTATNGNGNGHPPEAAA